MGLFGFVAALGAMLGSVLLRTTIAKAPRDVESVS